MLESRRSIVFIEPFGRGGIVHYTHQMANALARAGQDVTLIGAHDFELAAADRSYRLVRRFRIRRSDVDGGSVVARARVLTGRLATLGSFARQYQAVTRQLRLTRPDYVVVGTIFRYPFMGLFIRQMKRRGIAVVQICHEFQNRTGMGGALTKLAMATNEATYQDFARILFLSDSLRAEFAEAHPEIDPDRLKTIPIGNGQMFEELASAKPDDQILRSLGIDPERPFVLFHGRVRYDKGAADLVDAFVQAQPDLPAGTALVFLGDGPEELIKDLRQRGASLGEQLVIANGYYETSELWAVVCRAAAAAFPYRSGSQSAAMQAPLYAGRPILASTAGGLTEVISHGENGLLSAPSDVPGLAANLKLVFADPELAIAIGRGAAATARRDYAWSVVAAKTLENLEPQDSA